MSDIPALKERRFSRRSATAATLALAAVVVAPIAAGASHIPAETSVLAEQNEPRPGTDAIHPHVEPFWLSNGRKVQRPREGGTWEYGFWDAKARSYYTVNRCHGSSLSVNGQVVRSVNTAAGHRSIAEKWTVNTPWGNDRYYYRVC